MGLIKSWDTKANRTSRRATDSNLMCSNLFCTTMQCLARKGRYGFDKIMDYCTVLAACIVVQRYQWGLAVGKLAVSSTIFKKCVARLDSLG